MFGVLVHPDRTSKPAEAVDLLNSRELADVRPLLLKVSEHPDLNLRSEARRLMKLLDNRSR